MLDKKYDYVSLMGPTGSGKSSLVMELVDLFPDTFELISVDSVAVYRKFDIGSAKPCVKDRQKVPHHLIDIRDAHQIYNVASFCKDVTTCIIDIKKRKKVPILVGGTMLYFKSYIQGLSAMPPVLPEVRIKVANLRKMGRAYDDLLKIDPIAAEKINKNDIFRITRALEVYFTTGEPISKWHNKNVKNNDFNSFDLILWPKMRESIKNNIAKRFDLMLERGLVEELEDILKKSKMPLNEQFPSIRSIGYRQVFQYLNNELTKEQMREKSIIATCQYLKRQLTWLRNWSYPNTRIENFNDFSQQIKKIVS